MSQPDVNRRPCTYIQQLCRALQSSCYCHVSLQDIQNHVETSNYRPPTEVPYSIHPPKNTAAPLSTIQLSLLRTQVQDEKKRKNIMTFTISPIFSISPNAFSPTRCGSSSRPLSANNDLSWPSRVKSQGKGVNGGTCHEHVVCGFFFFLPSPSLPPSPQP